MNSLRAVCLVLLLALPACAGPAATPAETPVAETSTTGLQFIEFYSPL